MDGSTVALIIFMTLIVCGFIAIMTNIYFNHQKETGANARKQTENWIKAEKMRAANIDTIKIAGETRSPGSGYRN